MWRYIAGVKRVPDTSTPTQDETTQEPKVKKRFFNEKWRRADSGELRDWLVFDETSQSMFCSHCRQHASASSKANNSFIVGTKNLKLVAIKDHEASKCHKEVICIIQGKSAPEKTAAMRALSSLKIAQLEKLNVLFRSAHAIGKKGRPFSDYEWLCKLDEKKGINPGSTYVNRKQARVFTKYIAEVERNSLRAEIEAASFLSIMSDGSTDTDVTEEEILYVRLCKRGKVEVRFVGIKAVERADGDSITNAITDLMSGVCGDDRWQDKLVACATDGASVMTGVRRGVVSRLRAESSNHVLAIHCMAHRLELAFKASVKSCAMAKQLEDLLSSLHVFYHKSALNSANLRCSFRLLGQTPLVPTRVGGTRWVTHMLRALDHFLRGYQGLIQHLEQIQSPDAEGVNAVQRSKACHFFKTCQDPAVWMFSNFMHDCLTHLSSLSLTLQASTVTLAEVHGCLTSTQSVLTKYKTRPGPKLTACMDQHKCSDNTISSVRKAKTNLLDRLCENLQSRFADMSSSVLRATKLVDLKCWPDAQHCEEFGEAEVDELTRHFKQVLLSLGVTTDLIPDQWTILKNRLYQKGDSLHSTTWPEINRMLHHQCPDVLSLVDLVLSLPASTADCERGFNVMKLVKTDWRSHLAAATLSDLLMVQLATPSIEDFDPTPAVQLWHQDSIRSRRPDFMEGRRGQETITLSESDSDSNEEGF